MAEESPVPAPANRMAPPASMSTSSSTCASSSLSSLGKSSWPGLALLLWFRLGGGRLHFKILVSHGFCTPLKTPLFLLPFRPPYSPTHRSSKGAYAAVHGDGAEHGGGFGGVNASTRWGRVLLYLDWRSRQCPAHGLVMCGNHDPL